MSIPKELVEARQIIKTNKFYTRPIRFFDKSPYLEYIKKRDKKSFELIDNPKSIDDYINNSMYYWQKYIDMSSEDMKEYYSKNKVGEIEKFEYKKILMKRNLKRFYENNKEDLLNRAHNKYANNTEYYIANSKKYMGTDYYKQRNCENGRRYYEKNKEKVKERVRSNATYKYKYLVRDDGKVYEFNKIKEITEKYNMPITKVYNALYYNRKIGDLVILKVLNSSNSTTISVVTNNKF